MKLVVTRHRVLIEYLINEKIIKEGEYIHIEHIDDVSLIKNKDVIGVLPYHLACLTNTFTEVVLNIPYEMRGKELSLKDIETFVKEVATYKVIKL